MSRHDHIRAYSDAYMRARAPENQQLYANPVVANVQGSHSGRHHVLVIQRYKALMLDHWSTFSPEGKGVCLVRPNQVREFLEVCDAVRVLYHLGKE